MKFNKAVTSSRRKCRKTFFSSKKDPKRNFLVPLSASIKKKTNLKSLKVRKNDHATVTRGKYKGKNGKIIQFNRGSLTIFLDSVVKKKTNQTNYFVPIHISNISLRKFFVTRERMKLMENSKVLQPKR